MAPPRKGTLEPPWTDKEGRLRYTAKIRLADGTRHREHVPLAKCKRGDDEPARRSPKTTRSGREPIVKPQESLPR